LLRWFTFARLRWFTVYLLPLRLVVVTLLVPVTCCCVAVVRCWFALGYVVVARCCVTFALRYVVGCWLPLTLLLHTLLFVDYPLLLLLRWLRWIWCTRTALVCWLRCVVVTWRCITRCVGLCVARLLLFHVCWLLCVVVTLLVTRLLFTLLVALLLFCFVDLFSYVLLLFTCCCYCCCVCLVLHLFVVFTLPFAFHTPFVTVAVIYCYVVTRLHTLLLLYTTLRLRVTPLLLCPFTFPFFTFVVTRCYGYVATTLRICCWFPLLRVGPVVARSFRLPGCCRLIVVVPFVGWFCYGCYIVVGCVTLVPVVDLLDVTLPGWFVVIYALRWLLNCCCYCCCWRCVVDWFVAVTHPRYHVVVLLAVYTVDCLLLPLPLITRCWYVVVLLVPVVVIRC